MVKTVTREIEVIENEQLLDMGATSIEGANDLLRYYRDNTDDIVTGNRLANVIQIIEDALGHIDLYIKLKHSNK